MNHHVSAYGTYLLLLECNNEAELSIGKLSKMKVKPGHYLYVGSAFGPGGIYARVRHHQQIASRPHWHIDYLHTVAELVDTWYAHGLRCEHEWAQSLMQNEAATVPLKGFGSSDCKCATHLFYFKHKPVKADLEKILNMKLASVKI
jgi:Uri superfamily endonuclease